MNTQKSRMNRIAPKKGVSMGKYFLILPLALAALITPSEIQATGRASARSVAMGGAHIGLASGVEAARYNPANLGLSDHRQTGLQLLGIGANISNNSFSLGDYNKYTGAYLSAEDKSDILDKIPSEGLKLSAEVEASALSFSTGSWALTVEAVGLADANMSRDLFDLILNGNTVGRTINLNGSYSDAVSYGAVGLSYGTTVYRIGTRQVAVGATVKYLRGVAFERVSDLQGFMTTNATSFSGNGHMTARIAQGGAGYALDLGAALRLNSDYTVGLQLSNFLSHLNWNKKTEEHRFEFTIDSTSTDIMQDNYFSSADTTAAISAFSSNLPTNMTIGVAHTTGKLLWAVDVQQGFRRAAGSSKNPRLSAGLEWNGLGVLPLRAGYAIGGGKNNSLSVGTGLSLAGYYLDLAGVTGSTMSGYSAKGITFAISTGLHF